MIDAHDLINSGFEIGGALTKLLDIKKILEHKQVKGLHWFGVLFFTSWGAWNVVYYPHLKQPLSMFGGWMLVVFNAFFLYLMFRYRRR